MKYITELHVTLAKGNQAARPGFSDGLAMIYHNLEPRGEGFRLRLIEALTFFELKLAEVLKTDKIQHVDKSIGKCNAYFGNGFYFVLAPVIMMPEKVWREH